MSSLYDHPDIYDERFTETANNAIKRHYQIMFAEYKITTILDCSCGTGNLTFPLVELGYKVSASDISKPMIDQARAKAEKKKMDIDFTLCDFRNLTKHFNKKYSCVISTGNALVHVNNEDIKKTLGEMDKLIENGGYLYFDIRNYDMMLETKERFQYGKPFFKDDGTRINYFQVWDYNADKTITITILQIYEKDNIEIHREVYDETIFPVKQEYLLKSLKEIGYNNIIVKGYPCFIEKDIKEMNWHSILAFKK